MIGIKLKLQGKAKTHWKETSGRSTSHFSEEEVYIDEKTYLVGYGESHKCILLQMKTLQNCCLQRLSLGMLQQAY